MLKVIEVISILAKISVERNLIPKIKKNFGKYPVSNLNQVIRDRTTDDIEKLMTYFPKNSRCTTVLNSMIDTIKKEQEFASEIVERLKNEKVEIKFYDEYPDLLLKENKMLRKLLTKTVKTQNITIRFDEVAGKRQR